MSDAKCPELSDLIEELFEVRRKWYNIGVHLKIPEDTLDNIESTCRDDFDRALRLLMQHWRKQIEPKATWADLVRALRKRTVNEHDLAANLEERYVAPTSTSDCPDGAVSSTSQELSVVPYTSRPAQAALNDVVLMELDEVPDSEVRREIQDLHESFEELRMDVYSYLAKRKPDLEEFRVLVSSPAPSWKRKRPQRMTDVALDRIMNPETKFYQMFCIISRYTSWYNYELLEKIVKRYGDPDLKRRMEKYCTQITDFEDRTSAEVLKNIRFCEPQSDSVSMIAMLPEHQCNQFTMGDIRKLKHAKADEARIDRASLRLCIVHESSVKIIFLVPIALAPYLMVSSESPLLTSPNPLPEDMYERCVQYLDTEEAFRLMGKSVKPPTPHRSLSTSQQLTRPLFRSVFSSDSLTSELSLSKSADEESSSLYSSLDPRCIQVFHDKVLMNGDNAVVCKAQFLNLPCAAKYVHRKLTESSTWQMQKFLRGCKIVKSLQHPNVVTILGTYHDNNVVAPILLMELMTQSLKEFLDRARSSPPQYIQFDFCYDIAQGMDYLHAKKIIHGDLTATNVLVQEGRAKICGVMSLQYNAPDAELEQCPGTPECLPLQAVTSSDYDEKIDCFSFGVLAIHIATRETPKPRPLALQSNKTLSETERYERSLKKLKTPMHPLYQIITECLSDEPEKCPSAAELCRQLSEIKNSTDYRISKKDDQASSQALCLQIKEMQKEIDKEASENEALRNELEEQQTELQQQKELMHHHQQAQEGLQRDIEGKENLIAMLNHSNDDLEDKARAAGEMLEKTKKEVEEYKCKLEDMEKYHTQLKGVKAILQKEREKTETMEGKIKELESAKADYKQKLLESDRNYARLLSQQDGD